MRENRAPRRARRDQLRGQTHVRRCHHTKKRYTKRASECAISTVALRRLPRDPGKERQKEDCDRQRVDKGGRADERAFKRRRLSILWRRSRHGLRPLPRGRVGRPFIQVSALHARLSKRLRRATRFGNPSNLGRSVHIRHGGLGGRRTFGVKEAFPPRLEGAVACAQDCSERREGALGRDTSVRAVVGTVGTVYSPGYCERKMPKPPGP